MTDAEYTDDRALLKKSPVQAKSLLNSLKLVAGGICTHMNANKTEFMCFKRE